MLEGIKRGIIGNEEQQYPNSYISIFFIKCLFTHNQFSLLNTLERNRLMIRGPVQAILTFYKTLLVTLFEYYLYETYKSVQVTQLQESCLPISAVTDFYHMFASGASARLNRTTLHDMFTRIFEQESGLTEKKKGVVTFFNFTEIIFDIS